METLRSFLILRRILQLVLPLQQLEQQLGNSVFL